ncbi:AmmeMemoRadiSam system protein A [Candidatus Woesearchaeota archaeon]|nr:AmmeMemoRadiSam system protein A [Candidatus Woesearchaeota archaeon]
MQLSDSNKSYLLNLARYAIESQLSFTSMPKPRYEEEIYKFKAGVFVTLTIKGELRGCIGTIEARDTIENSVIFNAVNAAFYDPRFEKLSREELKQIKIEISILSEPTNLIYITPEDLLKKLNGQGIILAYNKNKALFLPQVWEDLPKKEDFLSHLCLKAGISKDSWKTKKLTIKQFTVDSFEEE